MGEAKEKNGLTIKKLSDLKTNYGINEKVIECLKEKHRIQGAGAEFLTELQKEVFSNPFFWDDSKNLLIKGQTSSGKTLLAQIATAYFCGKEMDISGTARRKTIYLVPLRAMVNEKREEFKELFFKTLEWRVYASSSDYQDHDEDITESNFEVAIIVYEKFFALLAQDNQFIRDCGLIVVDELQMMNDVSRGPKLEIALTKVSDINPACKILGLTTTQCDISQIRTWLGAEQIINYNRPKMLREYVVWPGAAGDCFYYRMREEQADGTASEPIDREKERKIDLDGHNIEVYVKEKHIEEKMIPGLIRYVRKGREDAPPKIIVFINNRENTKAIAMEICNALSPRENFQCDLEDERIQSFVLSEDEYAEEMIEKTLPYGVAFHHGGFSWALREFVEEEFRKPQGMINIVVATETLAIGVNMPADVVILAGITLPRMNRNKNEMRSYEYKNYVGRAGRLGNSADPAGRSYLLAPSEAKADDYWTRYVEASEVKISSALRTMSQKEQIPFLFNLIGGSDAFTVDEFNSRIQKTLAYFGEKDKEKLPGHIFTEELERYGLIEEQFGKNGTYERSRTGGDLVSYALSLDTVEIIGSTCEELSKAFQEEFEGKTIGRKEALHFMERHYLDILFYLSGASEMMNVFVHNRDEIVFTRKALEYVRKRQDGLLKNFPLQKILDATFVQKKPMPNPSKSFAIKQAICMREWMKGKSVREIREETGLSYINLGDLDRLSDVFAYIWEAMVRVLLAYGEMEELAAYRVMLIRLAGRIKYGVEQDLVILASRHVQYVTRSQLLDLRNEAIARNLSPEQYVRDPRYERVQKALRLQQFRDLAKELNEHYQSQAFGANIVIEAEKLRREDMIDADASSVVKDIYEKNTVELRQLLQLFQIPDCDINAEMKRQGNCEFILLSHHGRKMKIIYINTEGVVNRDIFISLVKMYSLRSDDAMSYLFLAKGGFQREELESDKEQRYVFASTTSFAKLYLLSLKKSSSLLPFYRALYYGYYFIPDSDFELNAYIGNFISEIPAIVQSEGQERKGGGDAVIMHVIQDKVHCSRIVNEFLKCLNDKFVAKRFRPNYPVWSDTISGFGNVILKDDGSSILVFVDSNFKNQRFIPIVVQQLTAFLNKKKIFVLYMDKQSRDEFLEAYPAFNNVQDVTLADTDYRQAAQMAYEALSDYDKEEKSYA